MLTKMRHKELFYPTICQEVLIKGRTVVLDLDCGAQTSVINRGLVDTLGLELIPLERPIQLEGIDSKNNPEPATHTARVEFMLGKSHIQLTCLVSDHDNWEGHILLGLNFFYNYMSEAMHWLEEAHGEILTEEEKKSGKVQLTVVPDGKESETSLTSNKEEVEEELATVNAWAVSVRKMNKAIRQVEDGDSVVLLLIRKTQEKTQEPVSTDDLVHKIKEEFSDVIRDELPREIEYRGSIRHSIDVIPGSSPTYRRPYKLTCEEKEELNRQIDELIASGRIYPTTSPYGAPVLFVKKKDGSKRLCCDCRQLNERTVKSRFPLPLIEELFDNLRGSKWYSSLDLIAGYHQIPVVEEDQQKTAFVTYQGQYAWRVMPFGLTNAPSTFQMIMNDTLREFIGKFVLVYLDDILIYSTSKEQHLYHLRLVLQRLRQVKLYAKDKKCSFFKEQVKFLGHVIDKDGIHMDTDKLKAMLEWPTPKTPKDAKRFLGLAGYYRKFVEHFSDIARPLHRFAAKKESWGDAQELAFQELKNELVSDKVLRPFDGTKKIRVTTDASNEAIGAVMELVDEHGKVIGPTGYYSLALVGYQTRWPIRDKELFAVFQTLKNWKHYLKGRQFELHSDHKSLETVRQGKDLSDRAMNWINTMQDFDFTIKYIPGESNRADGLSRISIKKLTISTGLMEKSVIAQIRKDYQLDKECKLLIDILEGKVECPKSWRTKIKRYKLVNSLLYYGLYGGMINRLVIPYGERRFDLLRMFHSSTTAGHPGISRMYARLSQHYYWKKMKRDVERFVHYCEVCQKSKNSHGQPVGVFHPLQIPTRRFEAINLDFVSGMNPDGIYGQIMVLTCRLTKWAIVRALPKDASTQVVAEVILEEVIFQYGVPRFIVSDRDPKFTNSLWEYFTMSIEMYCNFSTANNPQSDGQVERLNKTIVEVLRTLTKDNSGWVKYIPAAVFAYNTTLQVSIGCTPFKALRGYDIRFDGLLNPMWDKPKYQIPKKGQLTRLSAYNGMVEYVKDMEDCLVMIRDQLAESQLSQSIYYNQKHQSVPEYKVGDKILIHKRAYLSSDARRKFHYMWSGPFTIVRMVGEQAVEINRGELINNRKHNVFNVRSIKKFNPFESQYHSVAPGTWEELRRDPSLVARIVHIFKDSGGEELCLIMMDNSTEVDLLKVSLEELRKLLPRSRLDYLLNKYHKNRSWLRKGPMAPLLSKGGEM